MQHRIKLSTLVLLAIAAKPAKNNMSIPAKVKGIKISNNHINGMTKMVLKDSKELELA